MDARQFDLMARALAGRRSRRAAIRRAGGAATAVMATAVAPWLVSARKRRGAGPCQGPTDCGSGEACLGGTCVAVFTPNGGAGGGTVTSPYALAVGGGRLFVTDVFGADDHVRIFTLSPTGQLTRTGTFHDAYSFALGLALDAADRVYVASNAGVRVYAVAADGSQRLLATLKSIPHASGVAVGGRFLFVASQSQGNVRSFRILESDPPTYPPIATLDGFKSPEHLAADGDRLYVADSDNDRVQVYGIDRSSGQATFQRTIAIPGPHGVAVGGGQLYVASTNRDRVSVFDLAADGTPTLETVLTKGEKKLQNPHGVALGGGFLFVANTGNSRIEEFRIL